MDWKNLLLGIALDLIATMFAYLIVPVIIAFSGTKYETRKLVKITIINCVIVWILFRVLQIIFYGEISTGSAVFLWGGIGHLILRKNNLKIITSGPLESSSTATQASAPPSLNSKTPANTKQKKKFCSRCGSPIHTTTKKCTGCGKQYCKGLSVKTFCIILYAIIFITSLVGNVLQYIASNELQDNLRACEEEISFLKIDVAYLNNDVDQLEKSNSNYSKEIAFYDEHIVFIIDDNTKQYHRYDCFISQKCSEFWAHNIEYAQMKGYKPCPSCSNSN